MRLRYVQFAPVAYIVKLHIELSNASLIAKIVRGGGGGGGSSGVVSSNRPQVGGTDASNSHSKPRTTTTTGVINPITSRAVITGSAAPPPNGPQRAWEDDPEARGGSSASDAHLAPSCGNEKGACSSISNGNGIVRTVETMVVVDDVGEGYMYDDGRKRDFLDV